MSDDEFLDDWRAGRLVVNCGGPEVCGGCEAEVSRKRESSVCRSGCKTQDHSSYAECLKAAAVQIGNLK